MAVALARPQSSEHLSKTTVEGVDIVLALDVSGTMLAADFEPDRLTVAKEVAAKFIADRPKLQMPAKILMIPANAVMLIMNTALLVGMSYNPFLYYKF